jgi:hypothetical protein
MLFVDRSDPEESNARNPAIQPGTGYTTKPGVAALRRTPVPEQGKSRTPLGNAVEHCSECFVM